MKMLFLMTWEVFGNPHPHNIKCLMFKLF